MLFEHRYAFSDFSNIIPKTDIKQLAECDEQEIVKEIQVK